MYRVSSFSLLCKMSVNKEHIRHCLLYEFNKGENATKAVENINRVYGLNSIKIRNAQYFYQKFRSGNFSVEDEARSGRPVSLDIKDLRAVVEADPYQTCEEIADRLNSSAATISRHLREIGKTSKLGKWVPHQLSDKNKTDRVNIAASLLSRLNIDPFLDRIVTGDEKWILYDNVQRKRQWVDFGDTAKPTSKQSLYPKKVMLCIWWDRKGVVYRELMPPGQTITGEVYATQLDKLSAALASKRPGLVNRKGVILQHDNARPHVARVTATKLKE